MTPATKKALGCVDWGQVVANGGPPCFHVESGRFCLRAERWGGHNLPEAKADIGHNFVSLDTFCEAESKLAAAAMAAMAEKCAKVIDKTIGLPNSLGDKLRSISPSGVLDEALRKARLDEAEWWGHLAQGHHDNSHKGETCMYCQRLAALRATPQPTAVKENANE